MKKLFKSIFHVSIIILTLLLLAQTAKAQRRIDVVGNITYHVNTTLLQDTLYTLADVPLPLTCAVGDQCEIWSYGFNLVSQYFDTSYVNAPIRVYLELWEGLTKIETSPQITLRSVSGTQVGRIGITLHRPITPSSQTHVKIKAHTGAIGTTFDWPTIVDLTPVYGIGRTSTLVQALPSAPTIDSFTVDASDNYTTALICADREDASAVDNLEISKFTMTHQNALVDVNMGTYTKTVSYSPILSTTNYTLSNTTTDAYSSFNFTYPTWGYFRSRFKATDYEGKVSALTSKLVKNNPYKAPTKVVATYSATDKSLSLSWAKPTVHLNGMTINPDEFQGYLIYLRNDATSKVLYSYKVMGYTTGAYKLPNTISTGTYDLMICGWSMGFAEGSCKTTAPIAIP